MATVEDLWLVDLDRGAAIDMEAVKSRGDRNAVLGSIEKLWLLGPLLSSPYMKSLKGEPDLFELRPKRGACPARPIYAREGRRFIVLAVAPNKAGFGKAVDRARDRLDRRRRVR